jgi:hypothetical protein
VAKKKSLVSQKIPVLIKEGMPQKQAVAVAISMGKSHRLRPGGVYIKSDYPRKVGQ